MTRRRSAPEARGKAREVTTRVLDRVEDLRLLSDPVKLRIYEALREAPASALALARRFGTKPTALYHHFARLERAGLIEVAERRKRRGAVERLYRPTVDHLVVDRQLARGAPGSRSLDTVLAAASASLQVTVEDIQAASLDPSEPLADASRSEIGTAVVRVTPAKARVLMRRIRSLIELAARYDGTGQERIRLTLAIVPVGGEPRGDRAESARSPRDSAGA